MSNEMQSIRRQFHGTKADEFREFIMFKKTEAAGYVTHDDVTEEKYEGYSVFEISLSPDYIWQLGYDWALWQFPPVTYPVS